MSHLLWEYFYNEELYKFRKLLFQSYQDGPQPQLIKSKNSNSNRETIENSPPSKSLISNRRRIFGQNGITHSHIGCAEINSRDYIGLTLLHRAVSSTSLNMINYSMALLEHPAIDLLVQDVENGWTALHRALYFGNVTMARAIIEKEFQAPNKILKNISQAEPSSIIKVIDNEGNNAFDTYNATICKPEAKSLEVNKKDPNKTTENLKPQLSIDGDEVLAWGSSRNYGLGFGDQDDRRHPEKIRLQRRDHLLFRFYREHLEAIGSKDQEYQEIEDEIPNNKTQIPSLVSDLPTMVTSRPIIIQDVVLSKFHSAILTTDPESNLYMCGFGPGGRLGTGDQDTRLSYVPVDTGPLTGQKITKIALGQDHSLAVTDKGSIIAWGSNLNCQLGPIQSQTQEEKDGIFTHPQVIRTLKWEFIRGAAASTYHSVAYTETSLYTWGKNEGQLGLMDVESRNLEYQDRPRKIAASLFKMPICTVSAIDSATIVLLSNHTVIVFTNYSYNIVKFPLSEDFSNYYLTNNFITSCHGTKSNHISSITAGGNTIGAVSSRGDLFIFNVRNNLNLTTSLSNSVNSKDCLSKPERVWSLRKGNWDGVQSVGITENGSVIVCTHAGAVWRRIKHVKSHGSSASSMTFHRKRFKFERIPGLSKIAAVRSTAYGVYVAVQKNTDVSRKPIKIEEQTLWADVSSLMIFSGNGNSETAKEFDFNDEVVRSVPGLPSYLITAALSGDLEACIAHHLSQHPLNETFNIGLGTSVSEVKIPVHSFILGRSSVLRKALLNFRHYQRDIKHDTFMIKKRTSAEKNLEIVINFKGIEFVTLFNLILYLYTDTIIDVWNFKRHWDQPMTSCQRQIRDDIIKIADDLRLVNLSLAVRLIKCPKKRLSVDMYYATSDPYFFEDGDIIIELKDSEMRAHSAILCQRCPFFQVLFNGRATGQWLSSRRQKVSEALRVNLNHVQSDIFNIVLRHIYADIETDTLLFGDIVCDDIDAFADFVLGVMTIADELMLDRLSQICQKMISRFVNTKNICNLLNVIAPFSISVFKDFSLEYICLHLELMLENHLLNNLEENLMQELNEVVRKNQLYCLPFAKSGIADFKLFEANPELLRETKEERIRRCRDLGVTTHLRDIYRPIVPKSDRAHSEAVTYNPTNQVKSDIKSKISGKISDSVTRSENYTAQYISDPISNNFLPNKDSITSICKPVSDNTNIKTIESVSAGLNPISFGTKNITAIDDTIPLIKDTLKNSQVTVVKGWSSPASQSTKLEMREIMAQAESTRSTTFSTSIMSQKTGEKQESKFKVPRQSQKERKKIQNQQNQCETRVPVNTEHRQTSPPWQMPVKVTNVSLKEILSESPPLVRESIRSQSLSTETQLAEQDRSSIHPFITLPNKRIQAESVGVLQHSKKCLIPISGVEPPLQLSMADIIGQQMREQEVIKRTRAMRSLREIQEEQAFQEWWDQESRRTQIEEAAKAVDATSIEKNEEGIELDRVAHSRVRKQRGGRRRGRMPESKK